MAIGLNIVGRNPRCSSNFLIVKLGVRVPGLEAQCSQDGHAMTRRDNLGGAYVIDHEHFGWHGRPPAVWAQLTSKAERVRRRMADGRGNCAHQRTAFPSEAPK